MRAILLLLMLAFLTPADASHCAGWSTSAADAEAGGYYVVDDCFLGWCSLLGPSVDGALWIYEESNGAPGLQRGDEIQDDTCHGMIAADTIVV